MFICICSTDKQEYTEKQGTEYLQVQDIEARVQHHENVQHNRGLQLCSKVSTPSHNSMFFV